MARQQGWFALILALAIAAGALLASYPLQLGLDLRGGSQLTLQVLPAGAIKTVDKEQLEAVKEVLDRRINGLGVAESTLQTVGNDQMVLQLPGEQDPSRAAKVLGTTALLEFRTQKPGTEQALRGLLALKRQSEAVLRSKERRTAEVNEPPTAPGAPNPEPPPDFQADELADAMRSMGLTVPAGSSEIDQLRLLLEAVNSRVVDLFEPTGLTGKDLVTAGRQQQQSGAGWEVTLGFNREGGEKFATLTQSIAGTGRLLGIVLDGRSISEATVGPEFKAAGIAGGSASITGNFSAEEARDLEVQLRGGSLPLPVKVVEVRTVGPSLGAENVRTSLLAALSGLALVAVFMVWVYRLPGLVAVVALSLYALFNLAIYALIPVTLTLPGIAGFILSIGIAVDANVLIFERVKEELRQGTTLIRSIDSGFSLALSSILDGHVTGLISCVALFALGTGLVKGFAVTLGIGLLLSLFTALTCTRTLLRLLMSYPSLRRSTYFLPATQLPGTAA
ncbi:MULTISPECIES: protein translocase subunit SecD [unclassified Synechococcus]|uniref:protein translocase subunit SecD n=1 Tax=unclassified Synechococcus TaxID=2626047 RepID=UPI0018CECEA4|nr:MULTISPECIES: protein translocase subunit SecD [unclassified Synechococcus]MEA5423008.1 protein translocase subunit SecD [Synechococcus sp. CCY9202]QPN66135.1 protein translocase subunit SecD [Synechococcus sp. CBW1006]